MRALEELQTAVLDEGDVAPGQLELEPVAVVTGAEQHRLLVQRDAAFAVLEHALAHERGLGQLVDTRGERRATPRRPRRPELLAVAPVRVLHDGVGAGQDRRRRAVVAVEGDDGGPREALGELDHVTGRPRPEPVDRLRVVAHGRHAHTRSGHGGDDVGLHDVGVLELVGEDVVEARSQQRTDVGRCRQRPPVEEQVVVVDHVAGPLALDVAGEDGLDPVDVVATPRVCAVDDVGQFLLGVDDPGVDGRQCVLLRKAPAPLAQPELVAHEAEQVGIVALVEHGEAGAEADCRAVPAQQPVGDRVERATPDPAGTFRLGELGRSREHVARRSPREGQQQDPLGAGAAGQEARDPAGQRPRLAAAGSRNDQQVAVVVEHRPALLGVQVVEPAKHLFDDSALDTSSAWTARSRRGVRPSRARRAARPRCRSGGRPRGSPSSARGRPARPRRRLAR